jgi:hypothetical protein
MAAVKLVLEQSRTALVRDKHESLSFDLVLVIGYFRSASPLLSVIKYLANKWRIGVCFQPLDTATSRKVASYQTQFQTLCLEYGATLISDSKELCCRVLVVQQYVYDDAFAERIALNFVAAEKWGMLTLASAGLASQDRFLFQFDIRRLIALDHGLVDFLVSTRAASERYRGCELIEVGLPFSEYPIVGELDIDWIIATPTVFSFHVERDKYIFLKNVIRLLDEIPEYEIVAYKPHNGNELDYLAPKLFYFLSRLLPKSKFARNLFGIIGDFKFFETSGFFNKILTAYLHQLILLRAKPLGSLTPLGVMSLEIFLPNIRRGLIGGRSNSMWGSLHSGVPYLNCAPPSASLGSKSPISGKSADGLLDLNLRYFGIPFFTDQVVDVPRVSRRRGKDCNIVDLLRSRLNRYSTNINN